MNINNLTIKAQEVLQSAMNLASGNGNQAVEPLHILGAIVDGDDSVGMFLLRKAGVNADAKAPKPSRKPRTIPGPSATNTPR